MGELSDQSQAIENENLLSALKTHFAFEAFHDGQQEVVEDVLDGQPTIAIMPTGAGKSLCYQLPAVLIDGITLVVSPLIALMKDQVDALNARGIAAAFINSSQSFDEHREILNGVSEGDIQLLYVAPERFRSRSFTKALSGWEIGLFAIDEAHCISRWGHDFRPDYGRLGNVLEQLNPRRLLACTATATPEVRSDIVQVLRWTDPAIHVAGFLRPNLHLSARRCRGDKEREERLRDFIERHGQTGSIIIYSTTRRRVERFADTCRRAFGSDRVVAYHAGMTDKDRMDAQNRFMTGDANLVIATNAFGMGIDRADIRGVVHMDLPRTIEGYYQEVGRAGRDGEAAECLLLFNPIDRRTHEFLIDLAHPNYDVVNRVWSYLTSTDGVGVTCAHITGHVGDMKEPQVESALRTLSKFDAVSADHDGYWYVNPHAPQNADDLGIDHGQINFRREREVTRLDQICEFAYSARCRHEQILTYFGQPFDSVECPGCDRCDLRNRTDLPPLDEDETLVVRKALAGVARAQGRFGLTKVAGMLAGSRAKNLTNTSLATLSTYGVLRELGLNGCTDLLQALVDQGLCGLSGGQYPRLTILKPGWEVMQGRETPTGLTVDWRPAPKVKAKKAARKTRSTDGVCPWSLGLRDFRTEEATRRDVPAYVVFTDRTLAELVDRRPSNRAEFLDVHGLGPGRWDTFGEKLVSALAELSTQIGD